LPLARPLHKHNSLRDAWETYSERCVHAVAELLQYPRSLWTERRRRGGRHLHDAARLGEL